MVLATGSGCLPAISHGPRVAEGPSIGVVTSLTAGPRYKRGEFSDTPHLFGPVGVSFGHGWAAPDELSGGLYLGGHIPIPGIIWAQADLYLQAPSPLFGDFDAGIGINAGYAKYSPYFQFGRIDTNGSGWYTTQSITFLPPTTTYAVNQLYGWFWAGSVARQWSDEGREGHVFLSAGVGADRGDCIQSCQRTEQRYVFAAGVTLDLYRRSGDSAP